MCDALASRCWPAGWPSAGSVWLLVPAVWALDVFSRTTGRLLWEDCFFIFLHCQSQTFINIFQPTDRYCIGYSLFRHSQGGASQCQGLQVQPLQMHHLKHWNKKRLIKYFFTLCFLFCKKSLIDQKKHTVWLKVMKNHLLRVSSPMSEMPGLSFSSKPETWSGDWRREPESWSSVMRVSWRGFSLLCSGSGSEIPLSTFRSRSNVCSSLNR